MRVLCSSSLASPGGQSISSSSALSPAPSTTSSDDLCSDLDDTDIEQNQSSSEGPETPVTYPRSMWRPW
ncbi:hypothetical protein KUCAC02_036216 [Chaenocephalus aceratus]|nr:hypothetical protein KUCAC02_036216 [Chaenocephalus aceratus]